MTTVLIPGSFDPLHLGHVDIVEQAVELFGNVVVGVLYNYEKPSGLFTPDERVDLAAASLADLPSVRADKFDGLAAADDRARLLREVDRLPDDVRETLMLYYTDEFTYQELADLLGVSAATVNARLTKARACLRARLSDLAR